VNAGLRKLDISWNGFAQDGAKAFFKALKENEVLEELDISYGSLYIIYLVVPRKELIRNPNKRNNRIATEGAVFIAKGLVANQTLRRLKVNNIMILKTIIPIQ
jgi:hypothetical protein